MTPTPDLKAAALAATQGEWRYSRDKASIVCDTIVTHTGKDYSIRPTIVQTPTYENRHNDLAYIVAANPATILALLERLQVAEDAVNELQRVGDLMANVMFNLAQRPGRVLDDSNCAVMHDLQVQWDAARRLTP